MSNIVQLKREQQSNWVLKSLKTRLMVVLSKA